MPSAFLAFVMDYSWLALDTDDANKPTTLPTIAGGPSYVPSPGGTPIIYNYVNPRTGEHVVSLLPPQHPEMVCLQAGEHVRHTQFGILG